MSDDEFIKTYNVAAGPVRKFLTDLSGRIRKGRAARKAVRSVRRSRGRKIDSQSSADVVGNFLDTNNPDAIESSLNVNLFMDQDRFMGVRFRYPPFSTNRELYFAAMEMASGGELPKDKSFDEVVEWQLKKQSDTIQKYAQEFEEASTWMERYPFDSDEATATVLRMDGKTEDEIAIYLATRG